MIKYIKNLFNSLLNMIFNDNDEYQKWVMIEYRKEYEEMKKTIYDFKRNFNAVEFLKTKGVIK
ncbi:MAG: hypothetical protein NZZ41_02940 [Candidatus Dojkabacteria bacterium]|nr:hypothetical protein [Candidatus Dojkabacteria bacterium]